ncbi:YggS family pyridoxal phosphate-dependent enzyme [Candidatus Marinamargulisbacteria bacterium SCGC AG-414-C22]|nr:YggS family pyridoxal phosphate-dependent enzyme [Candidatus Marinamargulisbacteria bacterium SCGC AG-414-C22]
MVNKSFIQHQIHAVKESVAKHKSQDNVTILIASKYASIDEIKFIHQQGLTCFGENKVQDFVQKHENLKDLDIDWHFIGHLQSNKINKILPLTNVIQSVDRLSLLKTLEQKGKLYSTSINCCLQFNAGNDPNKFGFKTEDFSMLCDELDSSKHINLKGVMCMAPQLNDEKKLGLIFDKTKKIFDAFDEKYDKLSILSMGMSNDYKLAVKCGATLVRIGRFIFRET